MISVRFVNRFSWRHAFMVSTPSLVVILAKLLAGDKTLILLYFSIGILLLAALIGWLTGKDTVEAWKNGKWTRMF